MHINLLREYLIHGKRASTARNKNRIVTDTQTGITKSETDPQNSGIYKLADRIADIRTHRLL